MDFIKTLTSSKSYLAVLDQIQADWFEPHRLYKIIIDDFTVRDTLFHKESISHSLAKMIKENQFSYAPVEPKSIKIGSKTRIIVPLKLIDYTVQKVIYNYLNTNYNKFFSDSLYSFRKGYSRLHALLKLSSYIQAQRKKIGLKKKLDLYVYRTDLSNYTDSIPIQQGAAIWDIVEAALTKINVHNVPLYYKQLIYSAIAPQYIKSTNDNEPHRGIPMGSPLTNFIANIYLQQLDKVMEQQKGGLYMRFGDDIIIIHPDIDIVKQKKKQVAEVINHLGLSINKDKDFLFFFNYAGKKDPNGYRGTNSFDYLGASIKPEGTIGLKAKALHDILLQIREKIHATGKYLKDQNKDDKLTSICNVVNSLLTNKTNNFVHPELFNKIRAVNDLNTLKQLDFLIALEIAKYSSKIKSVKAFRMLPYSFLRRKYGLISLLHQYNRREQN